MTRGAQFMIVILAFALLGTGFGYMTKKHDAKPQASARGADGPLPPLMREAAAANANTAAGTRKVLYYRNPMGLPDTSPVPKKDPMGMEYIPVYDGDEGAGAEVRISTDKVQKLGVRTETARRQPVDVLVRAVGRIETDERKTRVIAARFSGYVEQLHVNSAGQTVAKGQPLFSAYSREILSAQAEHAIVTQALQPLMDTGREVDADMQKLADSSLARLKSLGVGEGPAETPSGPSRARHGVVFRSPVSGVVMEKKVQAGMRFTPDDALYVVADLSTVWVMADVVEQDIGRLRRGAPALVRINAYPDKVFEGKVDHIYPTLRPETRTLQVRIELPNPGRLLKPGMFADVEMRHGGNEDLVRVPISAVIDSGRRRVVLVKTGEGRFEPREVRLGSRDDDYVEVLDGVRDGEAVVTSANFLIDSESNLKAALKGTVGGEKEAASTIHKASGTVKEVDLKGDTVIIAHGPVDSLNWPDMTMEFKVADASFFEDLKPGTAISFEFTERKKGEWVVTMYQLGEAGKKRTRSRSSHPHDSH